MAAARSGGNSQSVIYNAGVAASSAARLEVGGSLKIWGYGEEIGRICRILLRQGFGGQAATRPTFPSGSNFLRVPWHNAPHFVVGVHGGQAGDGGRRVSRAGGPNELNPV